MDISIFNKILKSRYVPHTAWLRQTPRRLLETFKFAPVIQERSKTLDGRTHQIVSIHSKLQRNIYRKLCTESGSNYVVGISGCPTDLLAQQVAASILYSQVARNQAQWVWLNTGYPKTTVENPDVVVIYNVIPSEDRVYLVRDLLDQYPNSLRLVVVSGTNALDYFDNYLHYPLSGLMHFTVIPEIAIKWASVKEASADLPIFTDDIEKLLNAKRKMDRTSSITESNE